MSADDDGQDRLIEAAMGAALKALEDATGDAGRAETLWRALAVEMFVDQLRLPDAAGADGFAAMTNARLARDYVPFRLHRLDAGR